MKLIPIKKKKVYVYNGNVYDLNIDNDHTYNIDGNIVHNSDYVMIGSLFNRALESAGFNYINILGKKIKIKSDFLIRLLWKLKIPIYKKYRGMSTKEVQLSFGRTKLQTSEGITKYQRVEYTLTGWTDNFKDYLRSAMSYCGAKNLEEFIGKVDWEMITPESFKRFNK